VDLYAVLDVAPDADAATINTQWKRLQKAVHPDVAGAYAETAAALLNEARTVLIDANDRRAFDIDRSEWLKRGRSDRDLFSVRAGAPLSAWSGPRNVSVARVRNARGEASFFSNASRPAEGNDAVFVDESQCIGCVRCAAAAPKTFRVETRFGRARVVDQWADGTDAVVDAVETCPVRCIHIVDARLELPILERVTARLWRERGGGVSAKVSESDASPFEMVDALRRRADPDTGLAPWPSRRRRGPSSSNERFETPNRTSDADMRETGDVDTSAASSAVAAAVAAAAAAAAAAASAAADWRAGSFADPDDASLSDVASKNEALVVSPRFLQNVPSEMRSNVVPSMSPETSSRIQMRATSEEEVARLHDLMRGARSKDPEAPAGYGDSEDLFWRVPDDSDRASSSRDQFFQDSEDGDFAPAEWIRKTRDSRNRDRASASGGGSAKSGGGGSAKSGGGSAKSGGSESGGGSASPTRAPAARLKKDTDDSSRVVETELRRHATLLAFAAAFGCVAVLMSAPMDVARVSVSKPARRISETGGWIGETSFSKPVVADVAATKRIASQWMQFTCATVTWGLVLGGVERAARVVDESVSRKK
jgi:ferredoxin/uncharacterized membrane protein YgcG